MNEILNSIKGKDAYMVAKARAMITIYNEIWASKWDEYEIIDVEREFSFPLYNPETEAQSRSFDDAGKMDVVVRRKANGVVSVIEHKTTSDSVESDSDYWDRLKMDTQCSKYFLAASYIGDARSVIYDVLRKPANRPLNIPKRDEQGAIVLNAAGSRVYTSKGKARETSDTAKGYVLQTTLETPEQYEQRLLETMRANPSSYFAQREIARMDRELLEYMEDAWSESQQILYFRSKNIWKRNPDACKEFGTCPMFDLCTGRATVDGVRYAKRSNRHPELKMQEGAGGRELLTTSRIKAFDRCRRLHKLQYEDCIERVGDESEALSFGTLIHAALEAYFLTLKKNQTERTK